jgi:hypothetical protein
MAQGNGDTPKTMSVDINPPNPPWSIKGAGRFVSPLEEGRISIGAGAKPFPMPSV